MVVRLLVKPPFYCTHANKMAEPVYKAVPLKRARKYTTSRIIKADL